MTIRWAFERQSGSKESLSRLRVGTHGQWLPIVLALSWLPGFLQGQITPGIGGSQATGSVPLLGSVHFAGLTLTQAASKLTELYGRDYLVNPKVNVMLLGYAKRRFSILGQVGRPGSYEMPESSPGGIDLLEAIALAGGYTRIAAPERITVRRQSANGDQIFKVNAKKFNKGGGGGFRVEPGDTITVGESIF